jgi:hypothetical protein
VLVGIMELYAQASIGSGIFSNGRSRMHERGGSGVVAFVSLGRVMEDCEVKYAVTRILWEEQLREPVTRRVALIHHKFKDEGNAWLMCSCVL